MSDQTVFVCGLGRCGTSLIMKMLYAGGMPVYAENHASFEHDNLMYPRNIDEVMPQIVGHAAKILDPQRWTWGNYPNLKVIWMDRNHHQQAKSQLKLLRLMGGFTIPPGALSGIEKSLAPDTGFAIQALVDSDAQILRLRFEDVLAKPFQAAEKISAFIGGLDGLSMAKVVIPRSPQCAEGLEIEQEACLQEDRK